MGLACVFSPRRLGGRSPPLCENLLFVKDTLDPTLAGTRPMTPLLRLGAHDNEDILRAVETAILAGAFDSGVIGTNMRLSFQEVLNDTRKSLRDVRCSVDRSLAELNRVHDRVSEQVRFSCLPCVDHPQASSLQTDKIFYITTAHGSRTFNRYGQAPLPDVHRSTRPPVARRERSRSRG